MISGGLSAVLFGASVVASLTLFFHYSVSVSIGPILGHRASALAVLPSLVFSALLTWKIFSSCSHSVVAVFVPVISSLQLGAFVIYFMFYWNADARELNPCLHYSFLF
ncbi:unnamed protein product [Urochloa humidicola]